MEICSLSFVQTFKELTGIHFKLKQHMWSNNELFRQQYINVQVSMSNQLASVAAD
jgi:hypothetical protein